jgi:hypothetical protein
MNPLYYGMTDPDLDHDRHRSQNSAAVEAHNGTTGWPRTHTKKLWRPKMKNGRPVDQLLQIRITLMRKIQALDPPHKSEKSDADVRSLQHLRS